MSDRSWFYASQGQQQGPCSDAQFHEFIVRGTVTADTLVWSEGMTDWQKAREIPGLLSGAASAQPLSADFSIWGLFGRSLLYLVSILLIVPLPWVVTSIYRWFVAHLRVPQRPNLVFTGKPGDIWYVFVILALCAYAGVANVRYLHYALLPVEAFLSWMIVRWFVANISPDGDQRPLSFVGSVWIYIGWQLLAALSFITIIGWAWVMTAWMRWICLNVAGTRREIIFNGSGLEVLWRTVVFGVGLGFIIPIPWALGWYVRWYVSQFALVERTA
jgi:hypothetical protein